MASSVNEAQANFALSLLRTAVRENDSSILSPFSVAVALAMTYGGAGGETKKQMNQVLVKGLPDDEFHKYFGELVEQLSKEANGYTLRTANSVYVDQNFELKELFTSLINESYAGQLKTDDFSQSVAVANKINSWVESQTNSKIKNLVAPDLINPMTRLILINAVYFKGDWASKFSEAQTKPKPFYTSANQQRQVDMMHKKTKFNYTEDEDWQVLGLPYKNNEVFMYVFLPKERFGLTEKLKSLNGGQMMDLVCDCEKREVETELPKFKIEAKFDLVDTMKKMGIKDAFDESSANFSGISNTPLYISNLIHKAFIEVNEEGSEAAAATAGIMMMRMAPMPRMGPIRFIADHPFVYAIVKHQTVLFIGSYY